MDMEDLNAARDAIETAIRLAPENPLNYVNLSKLQLTTGVYADALVSAQTAINLAPRFSQAENALGNVYYALRDYPEAEAAYRRATNNDPKDPNLLANLGNALARQHKLNEAKTSLCEALKMDSSNPSIHTNYGGVLLEQGDFKGAMEGFERALQIEPELPDAHWNRGLVSLISGQLSDGFADYEYRWRLPEFTERHAEIPLWHGENLDGKSILIHSEQGFGDTFQFIRYAMVLDKKGAEVYLETHSDLGRLLGRMPSLRRVVCRGDQLPDVDFQIPILSIPHRLGTNLGTIPEEVPYIPVNPAGELDLGVGGALTIGMAWAGRPTHKNDAKRSISLDVLKPLFDLSDIAWVSLQVDGNHEEAISTKLPLKDLRPQINDFSDTAMAISNLDLVITVDPAVAHLAGALGKDVWILLPYVPDWRWMLNRDDSPWYPSARLFRQQSPGDWGPVISQITASLQHRLG